MGDPYEQRAGAAELGDTDLADQQADVTLAVIGEVTGRFAGLDRVVNVLGDPVVVRLCAHGAQAGEDARPVLAQGGGETGRAWGRERVCECGEGWGAGGV